MASVTAAMLSRIQRARSRFRHQNAQQVIGCKTGRHFHIGHNGAGHDRRDRQEIPENSSGDPCDRLPGDCWAIRVLGPFRSARADDGASTANRTPGGPSLAIIGLARNDLMARGCRASTKSLDPYFYFHLTLPRSRSN
jgi:hypothetical protein